MIGFMLPSAFAENYFDPIDNIIKSDSGQICLPQGIMEKSWHEGSSVGIEHPDPDSKLCKNGIKPVNMGYEQPNCSDEIVIDTHGNKVPKYSNPHYCLSETKNGIDIRISHVPGFCEKFGAPTSGAGHACIIVSNNISHFFDDEIAIGFTSELPSGSLYHLVVSKDGNEIYNQFEHDKKFSRIGGTYGSGIAPSIPFAGNGLYEFTIAIDYVRYGGSGIMSSAILDGSNEKSRYTLDKFLNSPTICVDNDHAIGDLLRMNVKPWLDGTLESRPSMDVNDFGNDYFWENTCSTTFTMTFDYQEEMTEPEPVVTPEPEPEPEPIPTQESSSEGGGCLIATAAFGSEMAPQVQFLREIRDNTVMSTQSGTAFITGFNQFYYSFSPQIADYERENPIFKEAVKVTLTPLLTSLTLLNYVEIDSEEEMLGYGIGTILLNVGMYFVAPAVLVIALKNRLKK